MTGAWLLDVGNSRAKLAAFDGHVVQTPVSFSHDSVTGSFSRELFQHLQKQENYPIWVCCSNPNLQAQLTQAISATQVLHVISNDQIPMQVSSEGTGTDRLLATWAAWQMQGTGAIVLDVGTAWTLDVVTKDGNFHGGGIGLSPALQADYLQRLCPHLPLADVQFHVQGGIPANTLQAVNAGIWQAFAKATDGLKSAWQEELGQTLRPVVCGGGSQALRPWLAEVWDWQPDLIFHGLAHLVRLNDET